MIVTGLGAVRILDGLTWALRDALADALGDQAERVERRAVPGLAGRNLVEVARMGGAQLLVLAGAGTRPCRPAP